MDSHIKDRRNAQIRDRRKAERRYVRRTVKLSALAGGILFVAVCVWIWCYPSIRISGIESDIEEGRFEKAMTAIREVDDEGERTRLETECRYAMACSELENGQYETARNDFLALEGYGDADGKADECAWQWGEALFDAADYDGAREAYLLIPEYPGVDERMKAIQYLRAEAMAQTDPKGAYDIYVSLGEYRDAADRARGLQQTVADMEAARQQEEMLAGMAEESRKMAVIVGSVREKLRMGSLCVGAYHTVGLKADGTVLAAGSNDRGQCDVSGWSGIVQVAAGAYHTVGLKADGTVVATGSDDEGQCDVSGWTGVVQIACGDYATFALLSDGTVKTTGYLKYSDVEAWRNVTSIRGGSYMLAGICPDGIYASHPSGKSDGFTNVLDMTLTTGGALALAADGTVTANFGGFPGWTHIAMISAGSQCVLGIDTDGGIMAHFFRQADVFDPTRIQSAACVAAGGGHSAILDTDGCVHCFGDDQYGQCDTQDWNLN